MPPPREAFLAHLDDVRKWCLERSGDVHLADDVAQETALTALTRFMSVREPDRLRGWLFRIAQRRLADAARRRRTELPLMCEPVVPDADPWRPEVKRARGVRRAVRKLPTFLRQPVRLHYLQGRPLREVAMRLHTTVNGVKARLYRARRILRREVNR